MSSAITLLNAACRLELTTLTGVLPEKFAKEYNTLFSVTLDVPLLKVVVDEQVMHWQSGGFVPFDVRLLPGSWFAEDPQAQ